MSGHNFKMFYTKKADTEIPTILSPGIDLYKASFNEPEVVYDWCVRAQSLNDILKNYQLPLVVKLCNDNTVKETEAPIDLQQPLLLYKEVRGVKLHARNIKASPAAHDASKIIHTAVGPALTIPDTYPGFFKDLDTKDHYLLTIADVTRVMPKTFLCYREVEGFIAINQLEYEKTMKFHSFADDQKVEILKAEMESCSEFHKLIAEGKKRTFVEGELFQKTTVPIGLYRPLNILEDTISYINKRKSQKRKLVRCLRCENEGGKHVLFHLECKGVFYIAELTKSFAKTSLSVNPSCRIFRWTEFDSQRLKGMRARLMHGAPPQQACQFTGNIELSHVTEEHTVIVCTMTSPPRLFEMAVTSEPFFTIAANSKDFELGDKQQKSLKFARLESDNYIGRVKVKKDYGIDEVVSQT